jgi:hypothetical protein
MRKTNHGVCDIKTGTNSRHGKHGRVVDDGAAVDLNVVLYNAPAGEQGGSANLGVRSYEARRQQTSFTMNASILT